MRIIQSACFLEDYIYDLDFCNVIDKTLTTSKIIDCLFDELEDQLRKMANEQISRDARIGLLIGSSLGDLNRNNADNPKAFNNHCFDSILHKVRSNYKNFEIFYTFSNTCVSSIDLFYNAQTLFKNDVLDFCFILAYDYSGDFIRSGLASYNILNTQMSLQSFDKDSKGIVVKSAFVMMLVGKEERNIKKRNCTHILSSSIINDAYSLTSFSPTYDGIKKSIQKSLDNLDMEIDEIDIIFCSTNGVFKNDLKYLRTLRELEYHGHISSVKHLTNHTLSASVALEIALSAKLIKKSRLDELCFNYCLNDADDVIITNLNYSIDRGKCMIVSTGFSGVTGAIIYEIS